MKWEAKVIVCGSIHGAPRVRVCMIALMYVYVSAHLLWYALVLCMYVCMYEYLWLLMYVLMYAYVGSCTYIFVDAYVCFDACMCK
jgi:hypothetical protein